MTSSWALPGLLLCLGCSSPLEQVFSTSGDAPSLTGLAPLGDGAVLGNEAGRVLRLGPGGAPLWTVELVHEVRITPAVVGELVVAATTAGELVGLEAGTGARHWRTEQPVAAALAAAGARAYLLSEEGELRAIEAKSGVLLWSAAASAPLGVKTGQPARLGLATAGADSGILLLAGPAAVVALSADDGSRLWRAPVNRPSGLLAGDGVVWTVDAAGRALALGLDTGEVRSQRALGSAPASPPARALDRIWVGLQNRTLVGFRPGDPAPPWMVEVPAPVVAAVVEYQGRLLVPTSGREGRLLALELGAPGHPPSARVDSPLRTAPLVRGEVFWQLALDGRVLGFRLRSAGGSGR